MSGRRALDLACGTGLSTIGLAARGVAATGIDIARNMLHAARQRGVPDSAFYLARAERLPFADDAFALVTCGQAFHWFDAAPALREIERVLVPGGAHAQFWKHARDDDPFAKAADELERRWTGEEPNTFLNATWPRLRDAWRACTLVDKQRLELDVALPVTVDGFIGYESSRETLRMALGDRRHAYLEELRAAIAAMAPPDGRFSVQAKEYCFLARRKRRS